MDTVSSVINPLILYLGLALGGVGVCLALPRKRLSPQILGALIGAVAGGVLVLGLTLKAPNAAPNLYFYIFSAITIGAALRVITHSRPVYAALYFILTVISTAGLFLILSAEFMAFALIIVYAGAILITYLFVIMLATQAPNEEHTEVLQEYDTVSREPVMATVAGFVLLAALTTMMFRGVNALPVPVAPEAGKLLAKMPRKVESALRNAGLVPRGGSVVQRVGAAGELAGIEIGGPGETPRPLAREKWPADLDVRNVEGVGFTLLSEHPGSIEIAGVVLLMAMLGAVVLSRKQVQIDEEAKLRQAHSLAGDVAQNAGGGT